MQKVIAILILSAMAAFIAGCTQGQLTPGPIKDCIYAARADAIVTAAEVRSGDVDPSEALNALDRIGGTPAKGYDDGLLSPVVHYVRGTKPVTTQPAR